MIFIFTGSGKGKTTAALGQALRAIGNGKRVLVVQFIKSRDWETGEVKAAERLAPELKMVQMGKGFVGIMGDTLPKEEHARAANEAFLYAKKELGSGNWDALVLDEINVALDLGLISLKEVIEFIKNIPQEKDLILTGRGAPEELYKYADYITEMTEIKHPFKKGIIGRRGSEW
ncbi:MAG: cob(I)yrinic acid a,c-diamide adenosyltransferase [Candidatus Paceibacteria bacterium]